VLPGFEKAKELPMITDVFSLVEHALSAGEALPIGGESDLRRCRDLLKQAITDVLLRKPGEDPRGAVNGSPSRVLSELTGWINGMLDDFALVTTNYDTAIECELYYKMRQQEVYRTIDLGFDWRHIGKGDVRTRPAHARLRVYKLHGSLDQLRCRQCGYVYFNPWGNIAHQAFREKLDKGNTCHCRDDLRLELHIVAPSLVREARDANQLSVWCSALEWMRTADRWIIAGYSLPPEDLAVRSLFLRACASASRQNPGKPKVTVVQNGRKAMSRYKLLFPNCDYESGGLEAFLQKMGRGSLTEPDAGAPGGR
jgi:hypothetical protein